MIASLAMYHYAHNADAHDRLWAAIRDGLRAQAVDAPDALNRDIGHMEAWGRADLCLSQICNLPYRARFRDKVTLIAACDYGADDDPPGYYHSVFVVSAGDPASDMSPAAAHDMAINEPLSNSGWGVPAQWAAAQGLTLNPVLRTGAHRESLRAVASGRAGLAAIDCITWRNLLAVEPAAGQVRVIGRTHATPGMTFITRQGQDPAPYRDAIAAAIAGLAPGDRAILGLRGIVTLPDSAYDIPLPPNPAAFAT